MSFAIMRTFNIHTSKFLFSNVFKTQHRREMFYVDCRPFSTNEVFSNIHLMVTSFRTLFISRTMEDKIKKINVTFRTHDGKFFDKEIAIGDVLQSAFEHGCDELPLFGACGGNRSCGTCHVRIPESLLGKVKELSDEEEDTIQCASEFDPELSRLSCCIVAKEELDGAIFYVPEIRFDKRSRD